MPKGYPKKKNRELYTEADPLDPPVGTEDPREEVPLGPLEAKPDEPVTRKPRKGKKGRAMPVDAKLAKAGANFILTGASQGYQMVRGKTLEFDPDARETFTALLGQWAEEEGLEVPLWVQVTIAGAACIIPAIVAAETGLGKPSSLGPSNTPTDWQDASLASPNRRPSPEVPRAAADNGGGEAGERKDVVA